MSAGSPADRLLRFKVDDRVLDLVSGRRGVVLAAERDAQTRWERYRVRLSDAREVFRSDRELEPAPAILPHLIGLLLVVAGVVSQAPALVAQAWDASELEHVRSIDLLLLLATYATCFGFGWWARGKSDRAAWRRDHVSRRG